jgi:hypothetical protein
MAIGNGKKMKKIDFEIWYGVVWSTVKEPFEKGMVLYFFGVVSLIQDECQNFAFTISNHHYC